MRQFIFAALSLSIGFSAFSVDPSSDADPKRKCDSNLDLVKSLRDSGVIQDVKYLSSSEPSDTEKKADLSAKRRELEINQDKLNERIAAILEEQASGRDEQCLRDSARLIRQLSEYANYAAKSNDGLAKFVSNWQAKIYTAEEYQIPIPKDLPLQFTR